MIRKGWPACPGITPWWAGCHPFEHRITIADIGRSALVTARSLASSRERSSGLRARAAALQTGCAPSEGIHLIGSVQPVWGHSTREGRFHLIESIAPDQNGLNDHRWGVSPHRAQAPSRSWSIVPLPRFSRRRPPGVYRRPPYPRLCNRPRRRRPPGVYRRPAGQPCTSERVLHQ